MRLVVLVQLVSACASLFHHVENNRDVFDPVIFDQFQQGAGEPVRGRRIESARIDQRTTDKNEMRPVGERERVDEIEPLSFRRFYAHASFCWASNIPKPVNPRRPWQDSLAAGASRTVALRHTV